MKSLKCSCLCGANKFTLTNPSFHTDICHCTLCRKWSAGPMMTLAFHIEKGKKAEDYINFSHGPSLSMYKSSDWAYREFCNNCGTVLFWKDEANTFCSVNLYAYNSASELKIQTQIFIDEKPDHYSFAGNIPSMTGGEVFAMFEHDDKKGAD